LFSTLPMAVAAAQQPLPSQQSGYTQRKFMQALYRFRREEVESYRLHTLDREPVRTACTLFLLRYHAQKSEQPGVPNEAELLEEGIQAMNAGSRDPVVLSRTAFLLIEAGRYQEAVTLLFEAKEGFEASDYPVRCQVWIPLLIAEAAGNLNDLNGMKYWQYKSGEAIKAWLLEEEITRDRVRFVWSDLLWFMWYDNSKTQIASITKLIEDIGDDESLDAWIREMIKATYYHELWFKRQKGHIYDFAGEIGQKSAPEILEVARVHYRQAHKLRPDLPEAATRMIVAVTEWGSDDVERMWFDRAVAAQFDFTLAYQYYISSFGPQYGGDAEAFYKFGLECAATRRYDTDVPAMLLEVVDSLDRTDPDRSVWEREGTYKLCKEVLDGMAQGTSRADHRWFGRNHTWIKNRSLIAAIKAGAHRDAERQLSAIGDDWDREMMRKHRINMLRERRRTAALSGPGGAVVRQIERQLTNTQRDPLTPEALTRIEKLLSDVRQQNRDVEVQKYLDQLLAQARREIKYESGEWVEIPFDKDFSNWVPTLGVWNYVDENTVVADNTETGFGFMLFLRNRFRGPFVMECDIETVYSQAGQLIVGILSGKGRSSKKGREDVNGCVIDTQRDRVGIVFNWEIELYRHDQVLKRVSHLQANIADGYHEMYVDGEYSASLEDERCADGPSVGIGCPEWYSGTGQVRFSNVRIRKWVVGPPPEITFRKYKDLITYYEASMERDPDNPRSCQILGIAYYHDKQFEKAIALLEKCYTLRHQSLGGLASHLAAAHVDMGHYKKGLEVLDERFDDHRERQQQLVDNLRAGVLAAAPDKELRDGPRALELATKTCQATEFKDTRFVQNLAAAYAEVGQFDEAQKYVGIALKLNEELTEDERVTETLEEQQTLYADGQPYRLRTAEVIAAERAEEAEKVAAEADQEEAGETRADKEDAEVSNSNPGERPNVGVPPEKAS